MPSITEGRHHRTVARRNRHDHSFLHLQSLPVQAPGGGNQGDVPPANNDNFTMENIEIQLAHIHGSLLSVGSALTDGSNAIRATDIRTREAMYRSNFTLEERRNLSATLDFVKEDVAIMADRLDMAFSGIRAICTRIRLLERNAQNAAATGSSSSSSSSAREQQRDQAQGRRRRHNSSSGGRVVEQVAMRMRQVRLTSVNFDGGEN